MVLEDQATLATDPDTPAQNKLTGQNGARDGAPPPSLGVEKTSRNDGNIPNEEAHQSKSVDWSNIPTETGTDSEPDSEVSIGKRRKSTRVNSSQSQQSFVTPKSKPDTKKPKRNVYVVPSFTISVNY